MFSSIKAFGWSVYGAREGVRGASSFETTVLFRINWRKQGRNKANFGENQAEFCFRLNRSDALAVRLIILAAP